MRILAILFFMCVLALTSKSQEEGHTMINSKMGLLVPISGYGNTQGESALLVGAELNLSMQYYLKNKMPLYGELFMNGILVSHSKTENTLRDTYYNAEGKSHGMLGLGAGIGYDINSGWFSLIPHAVLTTGRLNPPGVISGFTYDEENYRYDEEITVDYDPSVFVGIKPGLDMRILFGRRAGINMNLEYHFFYANNKYEVTYEDVQNVDPARVESKTRDVNGAVFMISFGIAVRI